MRQTNGRAAMAVLGIFFVVGTGAACGSGSAGGQTDAIVATGATRAAVFLTRSTFGPTPGEVEHVNAIGYEAWIDEQMAEPPSLMVPPLLELGCSIIEPGIDEYCEFIDPHIERRDQLWWEHALYAPDQLRQRVAFALSEIFVASHFNAELGELPVLLADYYDKLVLGAFGTYRELLEEVTLHPAMGIYLSMLRNRKADPVLGTRPDENFAREVMQLFSIGLVQLDSGGNPVLDVQGQPIPTYTQDDIEHLSRALTGWTFATPNDKTDNLFEFLNQLPSLGRMEPWPAFHDDGPKTIVSGVQIPGGLSAEADLAIALDALSNHPNTAPFISKQLIQRLVTSNPSPEYVARVVAVFDDNGEGVRGDLGAVVRAILLDPAATDPSGRVVDEPANDPTIFGKVREPVLRITALMRAFDATPPVMPDYSELDRFAIGQQAMYSPSVFNFFSPFYATNDLSEVGLVGPELQITTHSWLTATSNLMQFLSYEGNTETVEDEWPLPVLDFEPARLVSDDVDSLLDLLGDRLLSGTMTPQLREILAARLESIPYQTFDDSDGLLRVMEGVSLIVLSPEFIVQK